jgi:vacuolar iron transporter family protein
MDEHGLGDYIREIIFGIQDGAIGNLGLVVGLAQASSSNKVIFLAGLATMFAQAISMSTGNYLSVKSEQEYFAVKKKSRKFGKAYSEHKQPLVSSFFMAISVIIGAAIPLVAFFFYDSMTGIMPAILITLFGLFLVGALKTRYTNEGWFRSGCEVILIGALSAGAGWLIGSLF